MEKANLLCYKDDVALVIGGWLHFSQLIPKRPNLPSEFPVYSRIQVTLRNFCYDPDSRKTVSLSQPAD